MLHWSTIFWQNRPVLNFIQIRSALLEFLQMGRQTDRHTAVRLASVVLCWEHAKTGLCLCKRNFQQANTCWSRQKRPSNWHRGVETNNLRLLWQPSVFGQDRHDSQTLTSRHLLISIFPHSRSQWPRALRPLACWNCGFESDRGHGCLLWLLCVVR